MEVAEGITVAVGGWVAVCVGGIGVWVAVARGVGLERSGTGVGIVKQPASKIVHKMPKLIRVKCCGVNMEGLYRAIKVVVFKRRLLRAGLAMTLKSLVLRHLDILKNRQDTFVQPVAVHFDLREALLRREGEVGFFDGS